MAIALPPVSRSEAALYLTVAALDGRFVLQHCCCCSALQYPAADICRVCVDSVLDWRDVEPSAVLLATTEIHRPAEPYFVPHVPVRIGLVRLGAVTLIAHVAEGCVTQDEVRLSLRLDAGGAAVIVAVPAGSDPTLKRYSVLTGGTCVLDTPDPPSAAGIIEQSLRAIGFDGVEVALGDPIVIDALDADRALRVVLRRSGEPE